MSDPHSNRRQFKRIDFDADTTLSQGSTVWSAHLIDLSLKGLLLQRPGTWDDSNEGIFRVDIRLAANAHVEMDAELVHREKDHLGFKCLHIGLESIQHLRRLIELNLADAAELERELGALIEL
ncbi:MULTISPECIES: PilZ domain-containing protein [Pseudomonas]|uniref:Cyclic diguanosine monophosphate-binding protein n=1 Tax=Pseudomonas gingeri TaxID=117681 RepID=A0A7Y7WN01_9PSED|nr:MULTISPECIES: PilZ domain-containing protein [Pseudomonas]MBV6752820.1 PilZ domain-containing protein [Pseudomonas chlororaphis]MPQ70950.1 PilZ domain-containing protein [Pseudomonas sp. MWU12-2323]NWB84449.1 PilZ domain-containing protein [Pseudomonas gingeri]